MVDGWQAYIKNLIDNAPKVIKKAAIVGTDGSIWARSEPPIGDEFTANADELQKIAGIFSTNDGWKDVPMTGLYLEGVKYVVPLAQETLVFGKKAQGGVFVAKTNTAVLIALFTGETTEGQICRSAVERLAGYLQTQGY
jgi:hypothetical protein